MTKKQTTKKPDSAALLRRSSILKKENERLRTSLGNAVDAHTKQFHTQRQTISELRDLVDRREKEIMAMVKTDLWQHNRIETLEALVSSNDTSHELFANTTEKRISSLEKQLATAKSTLDGEREQLREQLQSVRIQNERLSQKHAAALEFIRAHCFE